MIDAIYRYYIGKGRGDSSKERNERQGKNKGNKSRKKKRNSIKTHFYSITALP